MHALTLMYEMETEKAPDLSKCDLKLLMDTYAVAGAYTAMLPPDRRALYFRMQLLVLDEVTERCRGTNRA